MVKCEMEGCENEAIAKGYCNKCYQIVYKGKDVAGVYKITYEGTNFYYIGSSVTLNVRKGVHKSKFEKGTNDQCPRIQEEFNKIKNKFGIDEAFKRLIIDDLIPPFDKGYAINCDKEDVEDSFYKTIYKEENGKLKIDNNSGTVRLLIAEEEHWLNQEIKKDIAEGKKPILRCENKEYPWSKGKIFDKNGELIRKYK
ncbi:TPA: hypothetical protein PTV34_003674 [Clostridium botulinum]|nr:hypothetical protein [Clostridium botulinum]